MSEDKDQVARLLAELARKYPKEYPGWKTTIQVAPDDCTGCGVCVEVCPAKNKANPRRKAINMELQRPVKEREKANYDFFLDLPEIDRTALLQQIRVRKPRLIKWDARSGNAILRDDGAVAWFDWEHCGRRNRLDDLIWLLGDEFTPDLPEVEEQLLQLHLPAFADDLGTDEARSYIATFGSFHTCVRLELILENKDGDDWWEWDYCLARDKVGVTLEAAHRLCARGARWASWSPLTEPLVPWFGRVAERLTDLQQTEKRGAA